MDEKEKKRKLDMVKGFFGNKVAEMVEKDLNKRVRKK